MQREPFQMATALGERHKPAVRGPAAVRASLIGAAGELFAARGTAAVSVREIADRAGVNHGLIHHYFHSKQGLVEATLEDLGNQAAKALEDGIDLAADGPLARYVLVASRAMLDNDQPASFERSTGMVELLRRLGELGRAPVAHSSVARLRAARLAALLIGWLLFEPVLVGAAGLGDEDLAWIRSELLGPLN